MFISTSFYYLIWILSIDGYVTNSYRDSFQVLIVIRILLLFNIKFSLIFFKCIIYISVLNYLDYGILITIPQVVELFIVMFSKNHLLHYATSIPKMSIFLLIRMQTADNIDFKYFIIF